jgi:hypothetical protein
VSKETHYFVLIDDKLPPELRGPYESSDALDERLYRVEAGADRHGAIMNFDNIRDAMCEYLLADRIYSNRQGGNDD